MLYLFSILLVATLVLEVCCFNIGGSKVTKVSVQLLKDIRWSSSLNTHILHTLIFITS